MRLLPFFLAFAVLVVLTGCDVGGDESSGRDAALTTQQETVESGVPPSKKVSEEEQRNAKKTPIDQIIRQAKPFPTPVRKGKNRPEKVPEGPETKVKGAPPKQGGAAATPQDGSAILIATQNGLWSGSYSTNPNRQVGKLYYDIVPGSGVDTRHCSATAVNSENKSLVVTAGHCVYAPDPDGNTLITGNGYWYEDVRFCPGYEYGCKLGVWYARERSTTNSWFYGSGSPRSYDWADDFAVVLVSPNASGSLVNAVGGQGITFSANVGVSRHAFGYPAPDYRFPAYSYNGADLIYCPGTDVYDGYGHVTIPCTMTGGASGGSWIITPSSSWLGTVNSVNSHKPSGPYMGGPYFGTAESNLYQYWRNR